LAAERSTCLASTAADGVEDEAGASAGVEVVVVGGGHVLLLGLAVAAGGGGAACRGTVERTAFTARWCAQVYSILSRFLRVFKAFFWLIVIAAAVMIVRRIL
jgi:hypothetical protein